MRAASSPGAAPAELSSSPLASGKSPFSDHELPGESAGLLSALASFPRPFRSAEDLSKAVRMLMGAGLADLPRPGGGRTLERWRALAAIGALDLSLAKIFEGHTDAIAILDELGGAKPDGLSAVWAAESPSARVTFCIGKNGRTISGRKAWCSGAAIVDHAVLTAWSESGQPILAQVNLRQRGVSVETGGWQAVGMSASESVTVIFENAQVQAVGGAGDYIARPGFWQGGAGIAAVWFGAAVAIAQTLAGSAKIATDPHAAAHLGAIDVALRSARALLIETAAWIDAHPAAHPAAEALRVRASVEAAANGVLLRTGRALGPGPLCGDKIHAQRCADLPVFLRQSHAEQDLATLGRTVANDSPTWIL